MEKKIITFTADEQSLRKTGGIPNYASNKVSYIEAQFELGENWQGFDAVRAIWYNKAQTISMVLADGKCIVPYEVLANKGQVMVNLVGSISENDVLTDRLTTYPVVALIVDADAKVDGSNTYPITPSQFEQFVEAVKADAESASESAESASASAESASASAESAHDDKIEIEQKIAEVIQQIEDFEQVEVVVNTLPAGSQATSDFTDGVLTLGIPQGAKGDTGNGIASCVLNPDYTLTINFTDGTSYTTASIRGVQGAKGDTGNGISSITKTGSKTIDGRVVDTYTTAFTDGETTEFEVTNGKDGEVTMSQLSALLPTDTASGSIASFPDGTDLFSALSVKAQIEPIQDLHGYDKPWSGGAGKNKFSNSLYYVGYVSRLWENGSFQYPITNTETGFKANVDANAGFGAYLGYLEANKTYTISYSVTGQASGTTFSVRRTTTNVLPTENLDSSKGLSATTIASLTTTGGTFTTDETAHYWLGLYDGTNPGHEITLSNVQLEEGSTATTYAPYSNICPISGHTECVTEVCGVNVWDEEWEAGSIDANGNPIVAGGNIRSKNYIRVAPSTSYFYNAPSSYSPYGWIHEYDENYNWIRIDNIYTQTAFTTASNCKYIKFRTIGSTYNNDISINYPSTDHDYHAYDGNTYTTALGRTVYGGTLDVVSGELVVDMKTVDLSTLSWSATSLNRQIAILSDAKPTPNNDTKAKIFCDRYPTDTANALISKLTEALIAINNNRGVMCRTSDGNTPQGQLVYELATPQTYQLDPQTIDLLLGQNNLWTDCGSVEVAYKADIERWVNKKINALI